MVGIRGADRKKGADLVDGSDVKGANTWGAIDTPRFNGVLKAGTKSVTSGLAISLDDVPHLYFVLWDKSPRDTHRCRIWVVSCQVDTEFREMAAAWYAKRDSGTISSNNFQLHPPRGTDSNVFRNLCGNLTYPLLFCAERAPIGEYEMLVLDQEAPKTGRCMK